MIYNYEAYLIKYPTSKFPNNPDLHGLLRKIKIDNLNNNIEINNKYHKFYDCLLKTVEIEDCVYSFFKHKCFKLSESKTVLFVYSNFMITACEQLELSNLDLLILTKEFFEYYFNVDIKAVYC